MSCCWPDNTPIVQGDVNITNFTNNSNTAYFMDIPALRKGDDSTAYFTQAGVAYSHYYLIPFINSGETHNRLVVCDVSTRTVVSVYDDKFPTGFHFNGGSVIAKDGDYTNILYAGTNNQLLRLSTAGGSLLVGYDNYTIDKTCYAIAYNEDTNTIYGRNAFEIFTITLNHATHTATTTTVFDLTETLRRYYTIGYDIVTTQGMCLHDGVFYIAASWPNCIFKISENGQFLGVENIPQCIEGRPCGELEGVQWCNYTNSFILNAIGRSRATYTDLTFSDQWMFCYCFLWGGNIMHNNRRMYASADGMTGVSVVGYNTTLFVEPGYNLDTGGFDIVGNAYHDGTTEHPFHFTSEAVYYSEWCQANTNRLDVDLVISGDFTGIEDSTVLTTISKVSLNGAKLERLAINNTSNAIILPYGSAENSIGTLILYGGSRCFIRIPCANISMLEGAELTANTLGTCTITTTGENLLKLGGTNQNITITTKGSNTIAVPKGFAFASGSTFGTETVFITGASV